MLDIEFSNQAEAFLKSIPHKHAQQILTRIVKFANNQNDVPSELLVGYAPRKRIKSGEYRVVISVEDNDLFIELIGNRNDDEIYKQLKRLY